MTSDRKLFWAFWFGRICLLFGTLGWLFAAYLCTFVNPDIMDSYTSITTALIGGIFFFSSFPAYRFHTRFNQFKKQLYESPDVNNTLTAGASTRNGVRHFIILIVTLVITSAFVILNFVLGRIAYLNSDNSKLFFHMVVVIATILLFNSIGLIYMVDENFKKIEGLISQYKKDQ